MKTGIVVVVVWRGGEGVDALVADGVAVADVACCWRERLGDVWWWPLETTPVCVLYLRSSQLVDNTEGGAQVWDFQKAIVCVKNESLHSP